MATQLEQLAETQPQAQEPECCERCGASEDLRRRHFMRVMSFLVFTRHSRYSQVLCPACAAKVGLKELGISSLLGWWGIPWGLMTFGALWTNTRSLLASNHIGRFGAATVLCLLVFAGSRIKDSMGKRAEEREVAQRTGNWVDDKTMSAYEEADRLAGEEKWGEARAHITEALALAPRSSSIQFLAGLIEYRLGDLDAACGHLETALRIDPQDEEVLWGLADIHEARGEPQKAAPLLRKLLEGGERDLQFHARYRNACLAAGEGELMTAQYRAAVASNPDSARACLLLGLALEGREQAIVCFRRALELDPSAHEARSELVQGLIVLRQFDAASRENALLPPDELASAVYGFLIAHHERRFEDALAILDARILKEPQAAHWKIYRSDVLTSALRFEEAHAALEQARSLRDCPPDLLQRARYAKIKALLEEERYDEALASLESAPGEDQADGLRSVDKLWLKGLVHWQRAELERATETFAAAPSDQNGIVNGTSLALAHAQLLLLQGDAVAATPILEHVVAHAPPYEAAMAQHLLARFSVDDCLARTKAATPTWDGQAYFVIGLRHELDGRLDAALAAYQASLDLSYGHNHPWKLAQQAVERVRPQSR